MNGPAHRGPPTGALSTTTSLSLTPAFIITQSSQELSYRAQNKRPDQRQITAFSTSPPVRLTRLTITNNSRAFSYLFVSVITSLFLFFNHLTILSIPALPA